MNSACTLLNVVVCFFLFVCFLFFCFYIKLLKKNVEKNTLRNLLTFQMQRCKQTALTLQSTRLTQYYKRINMEDSQRQTWRTKTWFYPILNREKKREIHSNAPWLVLCFIQVFIRGNQLQCRVFILKPLTLSCPEPRPALLSLHGDKATEATGAIGVVDDWKFT